MINMMLTDDNCVLVVTATRITLTRYKFILTFYCHNVLLHRVFEVVEIPARKKFNVGPFPSLIEAVSII